MPLQTTDRSEYAFWLSELKTKIRNSQLRAGLKINTEMLSLYWELGKAMTEKQATSTWGDKIITQLAADLRAEFKDIEGFSRSNLFNIRKWYQFYESDPQIVQQAVGLMIKKDQTEQEQEIVQQAVGLFPASLGLIPWGHHIQIITKCKSVETAQFYIQQTALNNWKRSVLIHQIDSGLYERKGRAHNNFEISLPKAQSELAKEMLKNPYNLGFLNLTEEFSERDLENSILANIKSFLLELGVGFSFCGQQYRIKVGEKEFYLDLLFYHTRLHCYFVIELKVVEFEPEHAGKLEFYITAIDDQIKLPKDNPTIGLLLCKTTDKVIVEYSLKTKTKPMGVAEYKHVIPKEWKDQLPNEKLLKQELEKQIIVPQKSYEAKIDRLKEIVKKINTDPADQEKDNNIVKKIFIEVQRPLIALVDKKLADVKSMFRKVIIEDRFNQQTLRGRMTEYDLDARILQNEDIWMLGFEYALETFIKGGIMAFNVWQRLEIHLDKHKYIIGPNRGDVWIENVYKKMLTAEDLDQLSDRFVEAIIEETNQKAENILNI